jgi:periplasmic protein CpxP/Spy
MTKIKSTLFALVVAASATVVATAGAQSTAPANGQRIERAKSDSTQWKGRGHKGHGREGMGPGRSALRGVKPTDAQKAQIKAIHEKYQAQFKSTREAMQPALDEAKAARQRGDTAAARAAFAKTASSRQQAQALRTQETAEIRAILTPEQQKTFDANVAQMKARGDHARKGRGNRNAK